MSVGIILNHSFINMFIHTYIFSSTPPSDWFLPAVGGRAPPAVRVRGEAAPQQELLILFQERRVIQDVRHLPRDQPLGTLWAAELHAALGDLDAQVLAQAAQAGAVAAPQQLWQLLWGLAHQAQGTLQEAFPSGWRPSQGWIAGGEGLHWSRGSWVLEGWGCCGCGCRGSGRGWRDKLLLLLLLLLLLRVVVVLEGQRSGSPCFGPSGTPFAVEEAVE